MLLEIEIFNVEKKHNEAHNANNKTGNELQINSNLKTTLFAQKHLLVKGTPNPS